MLRPVAVDRAVVLRQPLGPRDPQVGSGPADAVTVENGELRYNRDLAELV